MPNFTKTYYNIHGIVRFKVVHKADLSRWQFVNIHERYKNFETQEELNDLDFVIFCGKFKPSNEDCYVIENIYYAKKNYFYCKRDWYKFARWSIETIGLEDACTVVHFSANPFGYLFITNFIIEFLIQFKLNEKGFLLIHSSCVSKDNRAYLMPARSGSGKTTFSLHFMEKGFNLMADEFTILYGNKVFSFLTPWLVFTYNFHPLIKRNFGLRNSVKMAMKYLLYLTSFHYIKCFTALNVKDVLPNQTTDISEIAAIFLLIRKGALKIERIDKEELINHLAVNQELEFILFHMYTLEYAYFFPKSKISTHWSSYKVNLRRTLNDNIPIFKIELPLNYDPKILEDLIKISDSK